MDTSNAYGLAAFLAQSDAVGRSALAVLLVMSMATWYLIVSKTVHLLMVRRGALPAGFLERAIAGLRNRDPGGRQTP